MRISSKHIVAAFFLMLAGVLQTSAQTITTVTGTVVDANNVPYGGASVAISLNVSGTPTYTPCNNPSAGCQIQQPNTVYTNSAGVFQVNLYANASILPASSTYTFTVRISPGVLPPWGTGPQQCALANQTISGATQALTFSSCPNLTMSISSGAANPASPGLALQLANSSVTSFATSVAGGQYLSVDSGTSPTQLRVPYSLNIAGPRPYIDVTSPIYGAKGDGSTNDTAAIQAAITAVCNASGIGGSKPTLFFPPGTYNIQQPQTGSGVTSLFTQSCPIYAQGGGMVGAGSQFPQGPSAYINVVNGGSPLDVPLFAYTSANNGTTWNGFTIEGYLRDFTVTSGANFSFPNTTLSINNSSGTVAECPLTLSSTIFVSLAPNFHTRVNDGTHYGVCLRDTVATQPSGVILIEGNKIASSGCGIYYEADVNNAEGPGNVTVRGMPYENCYTDVNSFQNPNNYAVSGFASWEFDDVQSDDESGDPTQALISTVYSFIGLIADNVFAGGSDEGVLLRGNSGQIYADIHSRCGNVFGCVNAVVDQNGNSLGSTETNNDAGGTDYVTTQLYGPTITGIGRSDLYAVGGGFNMPATRWAIVGGLFSDYAIDGNFGFALGTGTRYGYDDFIQQQSPGNVGFYFPQSYPPTGVSSAISGSGGSLSAGTYTYNLRSTTSSSCSLYASAPSLTTTGLTITAGQNIQLTWTPSIPGTGTTVGYCLQRNPGPYVSGWIYIAGASTASYLDTGTAMSGFTAMPYGNTPSTTPSDVVNINGLLCQNCNQPQVYNIAQFGAKSDGVTDDTVAVQNTVNAACALNSIGTSGTTGATVLFPTGATVVSDHGTNPDGSTYAILIPCRGIIFKAPSENLYDAQLQYKSTPSVFGTAIQLGTPKEANPITISRTSNVVTATFSAMSPQFVVATGSGGANTVVVQNVTGGTTSFNGTFPLTAAGPTSASWTQTGANESGTVSGTSLIYSSADNALEYDGTGGHFTDDNVTVYCTGTASTALQNGSANYVNHTAAIWDWRSGYVHLKDMRNGQNCQYGFGGVQSQLDTFERVSPEHNSVGFYLGTRTDNAHLVKPWGQADDTGIWQNGDALVDVTSLNAADCGPSTYAFLDTTTGPTSGPPAIGSGTAWRRPNTGTNFFGNWSESETVSACPATFGLGVGDAPGGYGTTDINIYSHTLQNFTPAEASFIDIDQADHIHVYNLSGFLNQPTNGLFNILPTTCAATDITLEGGVAQNSFNLLKNTGPCTGTPPIVTWTRQNAGQYQIWQSNATNSNIVYQLLPGFDVLTGLGSTSQANRYANSGGASAVASFGWEQGGTLGWRAAYNTDQTLQFWDVPNSNFPQLWLSPGGAPLINAEGSTSIIFNGHTNSSAAGIQVDSGGATPTRWATIANYFDLATLGSSPGNPGSGFYRVWMNSGTSQLNCLTSSGASCAPTGGGGSPGGSTYAVQYNAGSGAFGGTPLGYTGQVLTFNNAAAPGPSSLGAPDSANSPVTTSGYTLACDSTSTIIDRAHTLRFQSGGTGPIVPLSTATGCGAGFFTTVIDEAAGAITFTRTGSDTFSVYNGSTAATGQTTFALSNGQYATLSVASSGLWIVRITTGGSALSAATYYDNPFLASSGAASTANVVECSGWIVPQGGLSVGHVIVNNTAADGSDTTDFGFYTKSGTLIAHTGPLTSTWGGTGNLSIAFTGGTASFSAGPAYACFTTTNTVFSPGSANAASFYILTNTGISTTGGTLPSTITPPSDSQNVGASNKVLGFNLAP